MIRREFLLGLDTFGLVNFTLVLGPVLKLTQEILISWANYSWTWPKVEPAYNWTPSTMDHKLLVAVRFKNTHSMWLFLFWLIFWIELYGCAQRFPDDPYDRIWVGQGTAGYQVLSTTSSINLSGYNRDKAPTKVLQTAQYWGVNTSVNLEFPTLVATEDLYYVVSLFFAEIESIAATEKRNISVKFGISTEISYLDVYNFVGLDTVVEFGWDNATLNSTDTLLLSTTADSLLGPMLNALAINRIYLPSQLTTNLGDGKATFIRNNRSSNSFAE